jgi:uncharacterized protein (TIGR02118 family)
MHKLLIFARRREGMSREDFRDYYENHHVPLALKYSAGLKHYVRRYLEPTPGIPEPDYDVVTELWFEKRAIVDAVLSTMASDAMPADVIADEHNLFDRSSFRFYAVHDCATDLGNE